MGKVARVALPIAALGAGAYFGPSLFASAGLPSFSSGLGGQMAMQSFLPGSSAGFSLFSAKGAGLAMGGLSALSSWRSGQMMKYGYEVESMRLAEEQRLANLKANIDEADALRNAYRARQTSKAKAAAMGQDISASRSFMAYLEEEDRALQQEIDNIRVNAASGRRTRNIQIASKQTMGSNAVTTAGINTGRNLFATAKGYMDV